MSVIKKSDGTIIFKFYRKQYKKARYRRWAERVIRHNDKWEPGWTGLIIW